MIHGYARVTDNGKVWLGFVDNAPIFTQLAEDKPTIELVQAPPDEDPVGYSVIKKGERHGFLYYPNEHATAEIMAARFSTTNGVAYECIPLKLKR